MKVLLTGGAGYIGSHIAVELLSSGHDVVIADNYSNSSPNVMEKIEKITGAGIDAKRLDVTDTESVDRLFGENTPDAVIHLAGYKAVGESVGVPLRYYRNNIDCMLTILEAMEKYKVRRLIFSSSATVYGSVNEPPYTEDMETGKCSNPYGTTKLMIEQIISDTAVAGMLSAVVLRYFNPVGAHASGLIGEAPQGVPNNLMPYITQVAAGRLPELSVYGNDYPTKDGTCLRDYIHVTDLAKGHVSALSYNFPGEAGLPAENVGAERAPQSGAEPSPHQNVEHAPHQNAERGSVEFINLGTGYACSVLEVVETFERVNKIRIPYRIAPRRPGDLPVVFADAGKALKLLGWKAGLTIEDMCRDAYNSSK